MAIFYIDCISCLDDYNLVFDSWYALEIHIIVQDPPKKILKIRHCM